MTIKEQIARKAKQIVDENEAVKSKQHNYIKPCPFCGSPAKRISHKPSRKVLVSPGQFRPVLHGVVCASSNKGRQCSAIVDNYRSGDDARCAWNRRV